MICNICGTENEKNAVFCFACGNSFINSNPFPSAMIQNPGSLPSFPAQIIGYDPNGMPIYSQPIYNPPIIGFDANGMPIYGQFPQQPQITGYDANGMPIYAPPIYNQYIPPQNMGYVPPPPPPSVQSIPNPPVTPPPYTQTPDDSDDFWEFFGEKKVEDNTEKNDFFGKSSNNDSMGDVSTTGLNFDALKRGNKKKNSYMNDTPLVDADKLEKHDSSEMNRKYMKIADSVNSGDLGSKETANHKRKEVIMSEELKSVEAMPKRHNPYGNELDDIELPEYMQARKTSHKGVMMSEELRAVEAMPKRNDSRGNKLDEVIEIPSLPDIK